MVPLVHHNHRRSHKVAAHTINAGVELADKLEQMCDPALRDKMSRAARDLREQVSLARHAQQMLALYDKLLNKKAI